MGEAKKHANDRKGDQVFKMSIVSHFPSHQNRR
jgi:hypothetical protein